MSYRQGKEECRTLIEAGYPLIYVVTEDERPVIETMKEIGKDQSYEVYSWNSASGLVREDEGRKKSALEDRTRERLSPVAMLDDIRRYEEKDAIFILHDFHLYFGEKDILTELKDTIWNINIPFTDKYALKRYAHAPHHIYKHIVITAPKQEIPDEIQKVMSVVQFGLPGEKEISGFLDTVIQKTKENKRMTKEEKEKIVRASLGLTETEIFNAYVKSMIEHDGVIDAAMVSQEKKQIIKKNGTLEYQEAAVGLGDVGGLHQLISWIKKRKIAYDEEIRVKYRLDFPKGILMTGIQGCGKSHTAKAIARYLEVPMVRMDIGALMDKWVGSSEENINKAIRLAESVSPCVLFIDEIDKVIPDESGSSHEVTKRIFSTLLTWLQEKKSSVFVVATANNIHHLPPELMRKGRFDEIFFVDLPNETERKEIFSIHLRKRGFDPADFNLEQLVTQTPGFSGSEIEALINEGNFQSAYEGSTLRTQHLLDEIEKTSPLSVTMGDKLQKIQEWAKKNNVRPAS